MAFYRAKDGLLEGKRRHIGVHPQFCWMVFILFSVNNRFQVRHSVIVIPRSDAESRKQLKVAVKAMTITECLI